VCGYLDPRTAAEWQCAGGQEISDAAVDSETGDSGAVPLDGADGIIADEEPEVIGRELNRLIRAVGPDVEAAVVNDRSLTRRLDWKIGRQGPAGCQPNNSACGDHPRKPTSPVHVPIPRILIPIDDDVRHECELAASLK
jgi:hypothetical protein